METQPALILPTEELFLPPQQIGQAASALAELSSSYASLYSNYRKAMHLLGNILSGGEMTLSAEEVQNYAREVIIPRKGSPKPIVIEELEDGAMRVFVGE